MNSTKPRLDNWTTFCGCLLGTVSNHPDYEDGRQVITSKLVELNIEQGIARTIRREYELGAPYYTDATICAQWSDKP